jgi:NhaP-type Na+/H+ or K+/H+ antiporter
VNRAAPQAGSKTAKIAYRPFGLLSGLLGGLVASVVFKQVWRRISDEEDTPDALQSEYPWRELLLAAALQGAVYAVVKAAVDRAGAVAFQRWTGEWPGD